jgi:hypothetical protein
MVVVVDRVELRRLETALAILLVEHMVAVVAVILEVVVVLAVDLDTSITTL